MCGACRANYHVSGGPCSPLLICTLALGTVAAIPCPPSASPRGYAASLSAGISTVLSRATEFCKSLRRSFGHLVICQVALEPPDIFSDSPIPKTICVRKLPISKLATHVVYKPERNQSIRILNINTSFTLSFVCIHSQQKAVNLAHV